MLIELKRVKKGEEVMAMGFIEDAKEYLKKNNVNQWQNGYPNIETIKKDVEFSRAFFIMSDGKKIGYVCLDFQGEKAYEEIEGKWKVFGKYCVIHRMTINKGDRNKGIAKMVFKLAEEYAYSNDIGIIRIDTDTSNEKMKYLIEKTGYYYCGNIVSADGGKRLAYEKKLKI